MAHEKPKGVLLINLGTPDGAPGEGPTPSQIRRYLRQFLMDPDVVDLPYPMRWLLVHGVILPRRPARTAEAYRKIWTERGSPLLVHHLDLARKLQRELAEGFQVEPAMRYGSPSIDSAIRDFQRRGVEDLLVFPLYPQYSLAATRSSVEACRKALQRHAPKVRVRVHPPFYDDELFIGAFAETAGRSLRGYDFDHLLFSFHGLPERQIKRADPGCPRCFSDPGCCDSIGAANALCYRAQCFATAKRLADRMGLEPRRYTVCFQSRMGRTPWIRPYTDIMYTELARTGIRRIAVICPAFVADCLETLEEVAIRGRDAFIALGGEDLKLVPSLNSSEEWVRAVARMVHQSF